jgi:hypothetical protein
LRFLSSIALLALAAVAVASVFFFTYAIVWFGYNFGVSAVSELMFSKRQHISHRTILAICWSFLALLFITNARASRDYWTSGSVSRSQWSSLWLAGVAGSLVALLVNASASAKTITDLLLTGPRLAGASIQAFCGALLLVRADVPACSDALAVLGGRTSSVSADELRDSLRCGDPRNIVAQLLALGTVLLLRTEPPTVTLNPDLRDHLRHILQSTSAPEFERRPSREPVATSSVDPGPYQVLGLSTSASVEEIRTAYRREIKKCHPDLYATHSDELRHRAEEQTKAIIAAYEELFARYGTQQQKEVVT